ncbi:MAG: hypothetical protein ACRERC_05045 [Candidatus Binatia bacterium]
MTAIQISAAVAIMAVNGLVGPLTQYTSPVVNPGLELIGCVAQNVGGQSVPVAATLYDDEGIPIDSDAEEVGPGATVEIANSVLPSGYCSFTFDADSDTLRGYIRLRKATGETRALFPAFGLRDGPGGSVVVTTTPPLRSIGSGQLACVIQNLGAATAEVDSELVDADGTVVDAVTDQVAAGALLLSIGSNGDHLGAYCRFSTEARAVRGYLLLLTAGPGNAHLTFPATGARGDGSLTAWTPPVSSLAGDATTCGVQNLGSLALTVDAEIVDAAGTVLDSGSAIVPPGDVETVAGHTEAGLSMVCRFTFASTPDRARAYISRFPPGLFRDTDLLALAEAPGGDLLDDVKTYSPPVSVGGVGFLQCAAVNLSAADQSVHYEIDDGDGDNLAILDTVVPAGRGKAALAVQDKTDARCTFAFDGSPDELRGFATVTNETALRTQLLFAAAPAGPSPTRTPPPTPTASSTATPTSTPPATSTHTHTPAATATAIATASSTDTPTSAPTATAPPTATLTQVPSLTPTLAAGTPTAQPTTPPTGPCSGDCDGNGRVTIAELITLVNIALGGPLATCPAGDRDGDGAIAITELIAAVSHALNGCPAG